MSAVQHEELSISISRIMAEYEKQKTVGLVEEVSTHTSQTTTETAEAKAIPTDGITVPAPAVKSSATEGIEQSSPPTNTLDVLEADPEVDGPGVFVCTYSFVARQHSKLTSERMTAILALVILGALLACLSWSKLERDADR